MDGFSGPLTHTPTDPDYQNQSAAVMVWSTSQLAAFGLLFHTSASRGTGYLAALLFSHRYLNPSYSSSKDRLEKPGDRRSNAGQSHQDSLAGEPGVPDVPKRSTFLPGD